MYTLSRKSSVLITVGFSKKLDNKRFLSSNDS